MRVFTGAGTAMATPMNADGSINIDALEKISIHSPARGETRRSDAHLPVCDISIHSPARGETRRNDAL